MNLRIARKIERAIRRGHKPRWSRDQIRRACLRVYRSPLQIALQYSAFLTHDGADSVGHATRGRSMVIAGRLAVFEQPGRLYDLVKVDGDHRMQLRPRP